MAEAPMEPAAKRQRTTDTPAPERMTDGELLDNLNKSLRESLEQDAMAGAPPWKSRQGYFVGQPVHPRPQMAGPGIPGLDPVQAQQMLGGMQSNLVRPHVQGCGTIPQAFAPGTMTMQSPFMSPGPQQSAMAMSPGMVRPCIPIVEPAHPLLGMGGMMPVPPVVSATEGLPSGSGLAGENDHDWNWPKDQWDWKDHGDYEWKSSDWQDWHQKGWDSTRSTWYKSWKDEKDTDYSSSTWEKYWDDGDAPEDGKEDNKNLWPDQNPKGWQMKACYLIAAYKNKDWDKCDQLITRLLGNNKKF